VGITEFDSKMICWLVLGLIIPLCCVDVCWLLFIFLAFIDKLNNKILVGYPNQFRYFFDELLGLVLLWRESAVYDFFV
jgi:hypothetical protein